MQGEAVCAARTPLPALSVLLGHEGGFSLMSLFVLLQSATSSDGGEYTLGFIMSLLVICLFVG